MRTAPLLLLLAACSDYDLVKGDDPVEDPIETEVETWPETETETEPPEPDTCEEAEYPGFEASINEDCANEVSTGTFDPVVEWSKSSWSSTQPASSNVMMTPVVGDLNLDGIADIVVITYSPGVVRAVSGDGSGELWSYYGTGQIQITGGAALGDIDNDGYLEVVAAANGGITVLEHDGTLKWNATAPTGTIYGYYSDNPAIADMDGDGDPEVIMGSAIWYNDGTLRGRGSSGIGSSSNVGTTSFAADLDGDGQQELIVGNAVYDADGSALWTNSSGDGYVAVADFDGDGEGEIVVSGNGKVRLQETDGTVQWTSNVTGSTSSATGPATIADYDGDGEVEIGLAATSSYTVFETDGTQLWQKPTQDSSSGNTGSAVFDFEGDGVAEAVYSDETKLWVFAGPDGSTKLSSTQHSNGTWLEYPVIADVDGDEQAEIVVPHTGSYTGFTVFGDADESWRPGRPIWNQHAYSITNVEDDGGIPSVPVQNWTVYNNFRSGDLDAGDGTYAPDLALSEQGLCEVECYDDRLIAYVAIGNEGAVDVETEVIVSLYAEVSGVETLIDEQIVPDAVVAGYYNEALEFDIRGEFPGDWDAMIFRILTDELECEEDNNELRWEGPFCEE